MSVKVSSWVWHGDETAGLAGNEMILLLALADVADDNGRCRFVTDDADLKYGVLAKKARVSRSTLIRLLARLREGGLLEQTPGVKGTPNEFRIVVPWAEGFGSNLKPNADDSVSSGDEFGLITDDPASLIRNDVDARVGFAEFYMAYPRKVAKDAARRAFEKAAKTTDPAVIVEGARRFAQDPNLPDKQFIPYPATWLNDGRWDDEALPTRSNPGGAAAPAAGLTSDYDAEDSWMAFNR